MSVVCSAVVSAAIGLPRRTPGNSTVCCETSAHQTARASRPQSLNPIQRHLSLTRLLGWSLLLVVSVTATGCANRPRPSATAMFPGWNYDRFAQREPSTAPSETANVVANRPVLTEAEEASTNGGQLSAEGSPPRSHLLRGALENPWSSANDNGSNDDSESATADASPGKRRRWGTDWLPGRRQREESAVTSAVREGVDPFEQVNLNAADTDTRADSPEIDRSAIDLANSSIPAGRPESTQVERLREALDQDTRRATANESSAESDTDQRAEVDALMEQAGRLLEQGEMSLALEQVQAAARLSEQAGLEYSPAEQRPIDLQRLIEDTIEQMATQSPAESASLPANTAEQKLVTTSASDFSAAGVVDPAGSAVTGQAWPKGVNWQPETHDPSLIDTGRVRLDAGTAAERVSANSATSLSTDLDLAGPETESSAAAINAAEPAGAADQHRLSRNAPRRPTVVALNSTDRNNTDTSIIDSPITNSSPLGTFTESPHTGVSGTALTEPRLEVAGPDVARQDASQPIAGPSTFRSLEASSLVQRRATLEQEQGRPHPDGASAEQQPLTTGTTLPWGWICTLLLVSGLPWTLRWFGKVSPRLLRQPIAMKSL